MIELDACLEGSVCKIGDTCAHRGVGARDHPFHRLSHYLGAETIAKTLDPLDATPAGRHLRREVTAHQLRHAHVGVDQVEEVVVVDPGSHQTLMGEADPFLVDVGRVRSPPSRALTADVCPMCGHHGEGHQDIIGEDRRVDRGVRDMGAGHERVVDDQHVPGREAIMPMGPEAGPDGIGQRADEAGDPRRFGPQTRIGTDDAEPEVLHLVEEGIVGRPDQGPVHLDRCGGKSTADHFDGDRVDLGHAADPGAVNNRFPVSSARATHPGGTSVVELHSSMTAGPRTR